MAVEEKAEGKRSSRATKSLEDLALAGYGDREGWHPEDLKMFRFLREVLNRIEIAYVGTYPPQECGIATFTKDVVTAVAKYTPFSDPAVVAVGGDIAIEQYPKSVKYHIEKHDLQSYLDVADQINASTIDVVSVQHEYGIFGGPDGSHVLAFMDRLQKPIVTTLHTVLSDPSDGQRQVMNRVAELSDAVVVMIKAGRAILLNTYRARPEKVVVIPHGVPNVHRVSSVSVKKALGISDRPVISTFGLISRGKGIEYGIKAMATVVEENPDAIYLVLGETHPGVRNHEGESYRNELLQLVSDLHLEKNVRFNNRYLTLEELINYLGATDVYLTPYINRDQITSGTLAYAIGCGKPVVSTPYLYAEEVLSEGRGILVDFKDPECTGLAINKILADPALREQMETKAYKYGRRAAWFNVAIDYLDLFHKLCARCKLEIANAKPVDIKNIESREERDQ
ncbi:MAG: glycosyltransferase family 4 protein [Armatimonadetes bacterium]|nr:glycosyltransferase family 4 protein [Armatimonadota bacterium]